MNQFAPDLGVVAVIVTYEPDVAVLQRLVDAIGPQVRALVMVHNGSCPPSVEPASTVAVEFGVLVLGENTGVARAQNEGIAWARRKGASHVLLLDQDSEPAPDMVAHLLAAHQRLQAAGCRVAALGARYTDPRQDNPPPFIRIDGLRLVRLSCEDAEGLLQVDYLVSSGSLIPLAAIEDVGVMREELFIDYVDIEWGLRASAAGLQSFGVCAARMLHTLGEKPLVIMGRSRPLHTPLRHYYLFRNALWMYRRTGVPVRWKLVDGWRLLLKYVAYLLYAPGRLQHWRMMNLGIRDGLAGRMGRRDDLAN